MDVSAIVGSTTLELQGDIEFESNEEAYTFYKDYAKSSGFGTSKLSSRRSRATKEFIDAKFSCTRYGNKQQSDDAVNPRPSPKIGCKASMHVKRKPNGKWYIHSFVKEHNHELLPAQAHFFRSHRNIDPLKNDAKVRRRKILTAVSKQYGAYQYMPSLESFIRNQHDKGRSLILEEGDAQVLLDLFVQMQEENRRFFYSVDLNEEHRLRNVYWVDAKGIDDYTYFGDVVCLDTTYFTSKYKIPLVLFVGVNHHIQPTLLGCGLIADDTIYTFVWLLQTWCLSMGGKAPRVILIDQNNALKAAVTAVFPDSQHFFSLWNVMEKIHRQLNYLNMWHDTFVRKFNKCIYKSWTEEQFEKRWWKLVDRLGLRENVWMHSLYEDRKLWVPFFMKNISFAGLSASSRSDSLSSFYDKYINGETSLRDFIKQYKVILEDRYEEEAKANFDTWHETPELRSPSPFEKNMLFLYTPEIFRKFQVEVLGAAACHLKKIKGDEITINYAVKDFESNQDFMVEWTESKSDICCSCRLFEYNGYLCRHSIVVLQMSGGFRIPFKYILQRWTNVATSKHDMSERLDEIQSKVRRYNDLCRRAIVLGEEGSLSEDSYNMAIGAVAEALRQCATVVNSAENDTCPTMSAIPFMSKNGEENQLTATSAEEQAPSFETIKSSRVAKKAEPEKGMAINDSNASKKQKRLVELEAVGAGIQGSFHQMEFSSLRPTHIHDTVPTHLNSTTPTIFHSVVSSQFPSAAPAHVHNSRLLH